MLVNEVLIDAFGRIQKVVHKAAEGLSEDQLAYRPAEGANTIAWLVWHTARVQDAQVANAFGSEEVWTTGKWVEKFGLPFAESATGYGQSSDEVIAVRANAKLLTGYYDAVHEQTLAYLEGLAEEDYERVVDKGWNPPVTLAVRLVSILSDDLQHAGQAAYVRGLLK